MRLVAFRKRLTIQEYQLIFKSWSCKFLRYYENMLFIRSVV